MPRGPRLDAPGVLHHGMARGSERRPMFRDARDRADFVARLAALTGAKPGAVAAWALLPNHLHLVVRPGRRPLARTRGALLAGYAGAFNRRLNRHGHLLQTRDKSSVVAEEPYLLDLSRYIHLNPLRAGVVRDLAALDRDRGTGHRGLLGKRRQPWQAGDAVLGHFGRRVGQARRRYRQFVAEGIAPGRRADLVGEGLRRSAGGWEGLAALRRGRERWAFDARVVGRGPCVARLLAEAPASGTGPPARAWRAFPRVLTRLAKIFGVAAPAVTAGSRRRPVAAARAAIGAVAVRSLGLPVTRVARALGVTPLPLLRGLQRGRMLLQARKLDVEALAREA